MKPAILTAYFVRPDDARNAFREVKRRGYREVALVGKNASGDHEIHASPVCRTRMRTLLASHRRWLQSEESVLVLQAPVASLHSAVTFLRKSGEIPPAVFFLNPKCVSSTEEIGQLQAPTTISHAEDMFRDLGRTSEIRTEPPRKADLLDRLKRSRRWADIACADLAETVALGQRATPIVEWILDNQYIVESNVRDVQQNLSRGFYRKLPVLGNGKHQGLPRIYGIAATLVSETGFRVDREMIVALINAYQSESPLTIAELWAIPQMLRIALIEASLSLTFLALTELRDREIADFWANRLIAAGRRGPNQLFSIMAQLTREHPVPSPYLAFQLLDHLYDEEGAVGLVESWLERIHELPVATLNTAEQDRQAKGQIAIGNAFSSLRELARLDWREIFEEVSLVERILRCDPAGVYSQMDFSTRDRNRNTVEQLAASSGKSEIEIAQTACECAGNDGTGHVGSWLIGGRRAELGKLVGGMEKRAHRARNWVSRHHTAVYLFGIGSLTAALTLFAFAVGALSLSPVFQVLFIVSALLPVGQLAVETVNYMVTRLFSPRALPKMDFEHSGIPDAYRTLVVIPMILSDIATIDEQLGKLEIRYLANSESNLSYALFSDYLDSAQEHEETDLPFLQHTIAGIRHLNDRYGRNRFYLLHRQRRWSNSEQMYIGWERKRGKLEELNRLINGTRTADEEPLVYHGDPELLRSIRFVITLDCDTQLPHGTARRMIETLAHPLNEPRFNDDGTIAAGSFSIIQPRVSPSLPSTTATAFSRLFAYSVGIDPYTRVVSDVYQDLTGEGSYHGKGIYDVRAFSRMLSGRFPEELLLSHDLIEGAHVRVGLASDIELLDEFPPNYQTYTRRERRWIRGDWQIADWILPRVPSRDGSRTKNPISCFGRWKILDNLRRSLLPVASLIWLAVAWRAGSTEAALTASAFVAAGSLYSALSHSLTLATTVHGLRSFSLSRLGHDLLRGLVEISLLPHRCLISGHAICRAWYRRFVSHRKLLEWNVAVPAGEARFGPSGELLRSVLLAVLLGALSIALIRYFSPAGLLFPGTWLFLWSVSPIVMWLLDRKPARKSSTMRLSVPDLRYLRRVARRTWRYYSELVSAKTSWLPPDNYQVSHHNQLAMRTSPTNIGLYLLSVPAAHEFGYLSTDEVLGLLSKSMESIARLERFEGHLLNWYDIETMKPLEPRYVSTVDSGNLLGSLVSLEHAIETVIASPVIGAAAFEGVLDTAEEAREASPAGSNQYLDQIESKCRGGRDKRMEGLGALRTLRSISGLAGSLGDLPDGGEPRTAAGATAVYWREQLRKQAGVWELCCDRYLRWMEIAGEAPREVLDLLGSETFAAVARDLENTPSLRDLATGEVDSIRLLSTKRSLPENESGVLADWIDEVLRSYGESRWLAGEMLAVARRLIEDVRKLAQSINMRFLYDPRRKLFRIGYHVTDSRRDDAYYDLLASEARIGSFVAIARGEVPVEHWFALGRPYNAVGHRRVLLSWTGTMFEYLMPQLLLRSFPHSLLDKAAGEAVALQVRYARTRGVPWGISESAHSDLDLNRTYQYRAFGVPQLGLKRGLEDELVVAPYASVLALEISPQESVKNLRRLDTMGLFEEFGFFDAIDFSRQASRGGKRGVVVRTYMSHHQGMSFLALSNYLHNGRSRRHFLHDARMRAFEPLLHESIPALPSYALASYREPPAIAGIAETLPSISKFDTPHTPTPRTQLYGNGSYSLMVTNAGGGYSQWGDTEITRWRADTTLDSGGVFCYIYEPDTDLLWSNTYHPTDIAVEKYSVQFALDRAVFRRSDYGIEVETEVVVSPEDNVEIRRITLFNKSSRPRHLELTSYVELSLAPHRADLQHPAFNKLFIQTEEPDYREALVASRRARGGKDKPVYVAHSFAGDGRDGKEQGPVRFDTDRRTFVGRGRTMENPIGASNEPSAEHGYVLDPILSLRRTVTIEPGRRRQVKLILAAGDSRAAISSLLDTYDDSHAIDRAVEFAWASAQIELRSLRIQPDEARRFQQIASHLLFPNARLRSSASKIVENSMGQSGLWPYGISGDAPILLVTIAETRDIDLILQMLRAHAYWRTHGFATDLVILNEEASTYEHPLRDRLETLVRSHGSSAFLLSSDQLPDRDTALLMAAARVVLVAARGGLPQQMGLGAEQPLPRRLSVKRRTASDASPPLPFMELHYFNGLGGFTDDGREYAIYLGEGTCTPAPWVNVIANNRFGTIVGESGAGFSWYGNSQRNRLTAWSNDPVLDPSPEVLYIRDEESGAYWTPTASPIREQSAYRARHGAGYSVFEHNSHGIEQELTVFVPADEQGGQPIKLQRLRLTNRTQRPRTLTVTHYVEWTLGENRESTHMHVVTSWDDQIEAMLARNRYNPDYGDHLAFAAISPTPGSYTGDRTMFIGRNRSLMHPAAMERTELAGHTGAAFDPCSALQCVITIEPGESSDVVTMLGETESHEAVRELVREYRDPHAFDDALDKNRAWWNSVLNTIEVTTPESAANFLINRWLLYQSLSCRMWGRSATYQSGGAFGYRDQLQDAMAFVYSRPGLVREQILLAASRQFSEGDVQHWWHPPSGAGIRSRISDDLLWLPYVVAQYIRITGDERILGERIPFLSAPLLEADEHELFLTPEVSHDHETLFEHCRRAVARGLTSGPHGLPLIGTGDWNDGMNLVGAAGRGESVWLAWFLIEVLRGMEELAELQTEEGLSERFERQREVLSQRIESAAWDGEWYLRGYFDDGSPVGSSVNSEAQIDSLPQSWARISGAGDEKRTRQAMESAWRELVLEDEGLVLLFRPPFDRSEPSPGYIRGYPPGVRENGGQYTHAALWFALALARGGEGEKSAGMLRMLNPVERTRDLNAVWKYSVEPYVIAADVYRLPGRTGRGGWSWYTGSAAWMYRVWVEEVLGLKIRRDEMRIDPVIPGWWDGFHLRYRHGSTVYEIQVDNPDRCEHGVLWIDIDGTRSVDGTICLERGDGGPEGEVHRIHVQMGNAPPGEDGEAARPGV